MPDYLTGKKTDEEISRDDAVDALRMFACKITCDREFIAVLKDADPALREQVYNEIRPHVAFGYTPRPFHLMSFEDA